MPFIFSHNNNNNNNNNNTMKILIFFLIWCHAVFAYELSLPIGAPLSFRSGDVFNLTVGFQQGQLLDATGWKLNFGRLTKSVLELKVKDESAAATDSNIYVQVSKDGGSSWGAADTISEIEIGIPHASSATLGTASLFSAGMGRNSSVTQRYSLSASTTHVRFINDGNNATVIDYIKLNGALLSDGESSSFLGWNGDPNEARSNDDDLPVRNYTVNVDSNLADLDDANQYSCDSLSDIPSDLQSLDTSAKITCVIPRGVGKGLYWRLTVFAQQEGTLPPQTVVGDFATSYAPPLISSINLSGGNILRSAAPSTIYVLGNNFGPDGNVSQPKLRYGRLGNEYVARNCKVQNATAVACRSVPGVGRNLKFVIQVGSSQVGGTSITKASSTLSYEVPIATSAIMTNTQDTLLDIYGTDFGPPHGDVPNITFGAVFAEERVAGSCSVQNDSHIRCSSVPDGAGGSSLRIKVLFVDSPTGTYYALPHFRYPKAVVSSHSLLSSGATVETIEVSKSPRLQILGANLLPSHVGNISFGPSLENLKYSASSCAASADLSTYTCSSIPTGVGKGHVVRIRVGDESIGFQDIQLNGTLSYHKPVIASIAGTLYANQTSEIRISGRNFGPVGSLPQEGVRYGIGLSSDGRLPLTMGNCRVSVEDSEIFCHGIPAAAGGAGGLSFTVTVGGQKSAIFASALNYPRPIISGFEKSVLLRDEPLVIHGLHFGPPGSKYISRVSYGRNGDEYEPGLCQVIDSETIRCTSVPKGTGDNMQVIIVLGDENVGFAKSVPSGDSGLYLAYGNTVCSPSDGTAWCTLSTSCIDRDRCSSNCSQYNMYDQVWGQCSQPSAAVCSEAGKVHCVATLHSPLLSQCVDGCENCTARKNSEERAFSLGSSGTCTAATEQDCINSGLAICKVPRSGSSDEQDIKCVESCAEDCPGKSAIATDYAQGSPSNNWGFCAPAAIDCARGNQQCGYSQQQGSCADGETMCVVHNYGNAERSCISDCSTCTAVSGIGKLINYDLVATSGNGDILSRSKPM